MARIWTKSQKQAIDAKGGSIIVSAAAGSGKTAVLVERVIKRIIDPENPVDADRILVVTYTRAAAAELKERLTKKISELVKNDPFNKNLLRQQSLLNKAHISTIHGFCSSIVKEYFYVLDIDRNFRIGEDGEMMLIKKDALRLTLDSMYADKEPDFFRLVEAFGGEKDDQQLEDIILRLHEFLRSHPYPKWWIEEKLKMFSDTQSVKDTAWYKLSLDYAKDACQYMKTIVDSNFKLLDLEPVICEKLTPLITSDADFTDRLSDALSNGEQSLIVDTLNTFVSGRISGLNSYKDHPVLLSIKNNRDTFKKVIKKLFDVFRFTDSECKEQIAELFVLTTQLFNCVTQFEANFQKLKAMKKVADFSDLEHWTIKLLVDENTREFTDEAYKIRTRFDEIMVDEYQDANEAQDLIFSAISKDNENLFFVGDVKQSIYGFRQAMPQLFLKRKGTSHLYTDEEPQFPAKILLDRNFRSISGVTEIVNFFFTNLMTESVGDIKYDDSESLKCGAIYNEEVEPSVEYHMLDCGNLEDVDTSVVESQHIAEIINKMIAQGYMVKDGDTYRPVTYGDFAVLMRKKAEAPVYADTLILNGIPACTDVSNTFVNADEIVVMTNFLSIIDNPALDIELLSVMMSPIFGFSADDLARIRIDSRYSTLYRAVLIKAQQGDEKCRRFVEELSYFRDICVTTPVSRLLDIIYERTGYLSIVSALNSGDIALNNLRLLKEYAKDFESSNSKGLSRFVSYLNRLKSINSDVKGSIDAGASSINAVRVMSVHASKGLEFPVCILANTTRKFTTDTTKHNVLLNSEYGIAVKSKDEKTNVCDTTMPRQGLALAIKRDEMSEELRVLYVAMTRAKQKLIMISSHKSIESHIKTVSSKLNSGVITPFVVKGCTYLCEWLTMCAMLHPDAQALRDMSTIDISADSSVKSPMKVVVKTISADGDVSETDEICVEETEVLPDESVLDTLKSQALHEYKNETLLKLPSKVAASELSHKMSDKALDRILDTPAFMSDSALTPAQKGTALHAFMQFCDFNLAKADIDKEIQRLTEKGFISQQQADCIDRQKALSFIKSDIINRCLNSSCVYKEFRFAVEVDASLVDPDVKGFDKKIVLQGAVDLAFVEDGELVIVDYKTDRVKDLNVLLDFYHTQLVLYKDAMEQCTDYKVKECIIYSVHLSDSVEV